MIPAQAQEKAESGAPADAALLQQILAADKNNDGKIDPHEFDGVGGSALWQILDADNDRAVTLEEARANLPKFLAKRAASSGGRSPKASTGLVPLTDLKSGSYKGKEGGLYPGGVNERPGVNEAAGIRLAREVRPRDSQGNPSPDGKIVFLSIG